MSHDWRMSAAVSIYKKKGSVMDCVSYQGVKLSEYDMKVVQSFWKEVKKVSES